LIRGPEEPTMQALQQFYDRLLAVLRLRVVHEGSGNCSSVCLPGKVTGLGIASCVSPGRALTTSIW
jgi:hypothetical protein